MTYLAQVSIQYDSGLPEDVAVNTFHFDTLNNATAPLAEIAVALNDFYDETPTGGFSRVASWLSSLLDPATWTVKFYDLAQPKPRVPVLEVPLSLGTLGTGAAPEEVAVCYSYHAAPISGVSQARRRNRIYLGPLTTGAYAVAGTRVIVNNSCADSLLQAGQDLHDKSTAALDWTWVVYSPTAGTSAEVAGAWVDNSLDTQRRRGPKPTSRKQLTY